MQDYKAKEENFASRNVMGTGPYRILSWQPEQRIMNDEITADWAPSDWVEGMQPNGFRCTMPSKPPPKSST